MKKKRATKCPHCKAVHKDHSLCAGIPHLAPSALVMKTSKMREMIEMAALLKKHGYSPLDAKKLVDEGMGPEELEHRIRTTAPGSVGSLEYTHGIKKKG